MRDIIIVKAGKTSKFNALNTNILRAITLDELDLYLEKYKSNLVVLESLEDEEEYKIKDLLESGIEIIFYGSNDVAEKLGIKSFSSLRDLQRWLYKEHNIFAFTDMEDIQKYMNEESTGDLDVDTSILEDNLEDNLEISFDNKEYLHKLFEVLNSSLNRLFEYDIRETEYKNKIHSLESELGDLKSIYDIEVGMLKPTIEQLELENVQLLDCIDKLKEEKKTEQNYKLSKLDYNGKARIILVIGTGSFGITSTAISIAVNLSTKKNTLYIDLDLISPRSDSWLKKNPIERNLPNWNSSILKMTGIGSLLEKGFEYFKENAINLIKRVSETKNGKLDYISGVYDKFSDKSYSSTDFNSFFNYVGNLYDYIVIDCGKIGYNNIQDSLIKEIFKVSSKGVMVTQNDKFDIRFARDRISYNSLDIDKIVWILNMCTSTKIDDVSLKCMCGAERVSIPFESSLLGSRVDFNKNKLTKERILDVVNLIGEK